MNPRRPLATPEQVAEHYGVPIATLYQWRSRGIGPRSSKIGRHIRYRWEDVEKYFDEHTDARVA
jgi:predicted DNA-binding transcriptional regulator AlpA